MFIQCEQMNIQKYFHSCICCINELSFCHKLWFSYSLYIFGTQCRKPLIFQIYIIWFNRSRSLKFQRYTTLENLGIWISEFVSNTQFLCKSELKLISFIWKANCVAHNSAQFCEYWIASLIAIIAQFRNEMAQAEAIIRAIPLNGIRLETLPTRDKNLLTAWNSSIMKTKGYLNTPVSNLRYTLDVH